jgi:hypothetical protein
MAIACLRLLCSPCLKWRISVATSSCALGPYLLRLDRPDDLLEEDPPAREDDRPEDFFAADFLADDFFAAVRLPVGRVAEDLEDFFATVRPALDLLPERLDDDLLFDDFFAAARPLEPRLDDDLPDDLLDDFFALDFFVAIRNFSLEVT